MRRILVIEDEIIIAEDLRSNLEEMNYEVVCVAINYKEVVAFLEKDIGFDIALVDIMLGGAKNGFDVARLIKQKRNAPFIFLTSYSDQNTLEDARELEPAGYVLKPYNVKDLYAAIEIVPLKQQTQNPKNSTDENIIFIKNKDVLKKVDVNKISRIKADGNYLELYYLGERVLVRSTLDKFLSAYNTDLIRVHKSYAVNLHAIDSLSGAFIQTGDIQIPIGTTYKKELLNKLNIK
ncbi:MAG: response regulator [Flavobacteriales bacterium]|nr:response regulator [Flavobacteriales bacterium]